MSVAIPGGNDPFSGGSKTPNAPPTAVGGSIAPAQTGVSNPIAGVAANNPFFARNNRGSNIGIPYARLCPLGGERSMMGLGPPPGPGKNDPNIPKVITETDELRSTKLAFILGRRSSNLAGVPTGTPTGPNDPNDPRDFNVDPGVLPDGTDYGFQLAIHNGFAPGVPGTERFQKLCSFEYLQRYFSNVLCFKAVRLNQSFTQAFGATGDAYSTGVARTAKAFETKKAQLVKAVAAGGAGADPAKLYGDTNVATAKFTSVPDLGKAYGMPGSDAADAPELLQGIFARDTGPFLRGKGSGGTGVVMGTADGVPQTVANTGGGAIDGAAVQPYHVSRCMGDELAFAMLERQLEALGLTDWRPDGIVLSLGANDPSDKLSDEALAARDGQLFNVRIQGPAVGSSWTGDPCMEVLPLDRVFVVLVADVVFDDLPATPKVNDPKDASKKIDDPLWVNAKAFVEAVAPGNAASPATRPSKEQLEAYLKLRELLLEGNNAVKKDDVTLQRARVEPGSYDGVTRKVHDGPIAIEAAGDGTFAAAAKTAFKDKTGAAKTRLVNFRPMLATSSQMINYSSLKFDINGAQMAGPKVVDDAFLRAPSTSRMGLRLGKEMGEYIVGGWCIGNVLDTSASRAAFPGAGTNIGVRTAPNTAAFNVNVQIDWWDSDRMWRTFMNVEDSLKPRYVVTPGTLAAVQNPLNRNPNDVKKLDAATLAAAAAAAKTVADAAKAKSDKSKTAADLAAWVAAQAEEARLKAQAAATPEAYNPAAFA